MLNVVSLWGYILLEAYSKCSEQVHICKIIIRNCKQCSSTQLVRNYLYISVHQLNTWPIRSLHANIKVKSSLQSLVSLTILHKIP